MIGTPRTRSTKSRDARRTGKFDDDSPIASGTAPAMPIANADSVSMSVMGSP